MADGSIRFRGRPIELEDPLFVRLINCETAAERTKFGDRFGEFGDQVDPTHFADGLREAVAHVLGPDETEAYSGGFFEVMNLELQGAQLVPKFRANPGEPFRLVFEAPNLAVFMLCELASALEAGAKGKRCEHCRRLFLHGPQTGRRSHARYCADRCRVAAMRARNASQGDRE